MLMVKNIKKIASSKDISKDLKALIVEYKPIEKIDSNLEIKEIMSEMFKGKK